MLASVYDPFVPVPFVERVISNAVRADHPYFSIPSPSETIWTICQSMEFDAEIGTRFIVRRDYEFWKDKCIVYDYLLVKAPERVFGGWVRLMVAYYLEEGSSYPPDHARLCQPIRFSPYQPPFPIRFT